jgi:type I restriction enzyme M protein
MAKANTNQTDRDYCNRTCYKNIPGYCYCASLEEIKSHHYVLTPGRYVGAAPIEDDGIPFETKMTELSTTLYEQMRESVKLDETIRKNLEYLGFQEVRSERGEG